jgi:hypothetical protein
VYVCCKDFGGEKFTTSGLIIFKQIVTVKTKRRAEVDKPVSFAIVCLHFSPHLAERFYTIEFYQKSYRWQWIPTCFAWRGLFEAPTS